MLACVRHVQYAQSLEGGWRYLKHHLSCSRFISRAPTVLSGTRGDANGVRQALTFRRHFAQMEDAGGPPAEKDTQTARGLETQAPATEEERNIRAAEAKFEEWR